MASKPPAREPHLGDEKDLGVVEEGGSVDQGRDVEEGEGAEKGRNVEKGRDVEKGRNTEKGRKPELQSPPPSPPPSGSHPQRPQRATPHPLHRLQKKSYAPTVSSPLNPDGNSSEGSVESTASERKPREPQIMKSVHLAIRRSLYNIDAPRAAPRLLDEKAAVGYPGYDSQSDPPTRSTSPQVSLKSIGYDSSRYSSRQASSTPSSFLYNETSTSLGQAFDMADPERGFSPYFDQRSTPVVYPAIGELEKDDILHNPDAYEDAEPSLRECFSHCSLRFIVTFACFILLMIGPAILFIVWPILAYSRIHRWGEEPTPTWHPILGAIRTSLIDPDTPDYALTRDSALGRGKLRLVFSDEFNTDGRTFYQNDDQFWQGADFHYAATGDLQWYDPDAITTQNGTLRIHMDAMKSHDLDYRSGMLQSWNKMCFKGGVMEVSASLAGPAGVPGLWPGVWTMGNLARPGYRATTDGVWPYSYDECDAGITPNQSGTDGMSLMPGQRLAKCGCRGEDHPTPGRGRGAPEIDALEATAKNDMPLSVATQSSQVAPFDIWYRADPKFLSIRDHGVTQMNSWSGGPYQQAISGVTMLDNQWYDGIEFQKYAFEYLPGREDGAIVWFIGDDETFRMLGKAIGPNGNVGQRDVSREPMSIILNLAISTTWASIDWAKLGPRLAEGTTMYIDYVRIYQKEGEESITCDPPGYYTTEYISKHPRAYNTVNFTTWNETGYPWPKNQLMDGCDP